MMRAVWLSYVIVIAAYYSVACAGYAAFGSSVSSGKAAPAQPKPGGRAPKPGGQPAQPSARAAAARLGRRGGERRLGCQCWAAGRQHPGLQRLARAEATP